MEFARIEEAVAVLEKAARELRPELLYPEDVTTHLDLATRGERHCASMRTALASRLAETKVWAQEGFASPEAFLARATGTSFGQAKDTIRTAKRLKDLPEIDEAFKAGELSPAQVSVMADAGAADSSSQAELLEEARAGTVSGLKEKALRIKARA